MPAASISTKLLRGQNELDIHQAASALRAGQLIAFPTETVYGLGADACNETAVKSIYQAKGRPNDNPLIVHLSSVSDLTKWTLTPPLTPAATRLTKVFWPGPLTLVLPLSHNSPLARTVTGGLSSVGLRVPRHPVAAALLSKAGVPVAAPSANLSGRPSPTTAQHVLRDLSACGRVFAVVDGGEPTMDVCGLESTVVDLTDENCPAVLRPGAVSMKELEEVSGLQFVEGMKQGVEVEKPKAPGMKYRHYAPRAQVVVMKEEGLEKEIRERVESGKIVGLLADERICEKWEKMKNVYAVKCGKGDDEASFGRGLYAGLRSFDGEGKMSVQVAVDVILAVTPKDMTEGIGTAIMNRLSKAAAGQ